MTVDADDAILRAFRRRFGRALDESLAGAGQRVLAGVSGGCDSVVLAWALREEARARGGTVVLGHVNHGLRADAGEDEAFVRDLAKRWEVPLEVARIDVARAAGAEGWSREQPSRIPDSTRAT